ncbi:MAG: glutaminase A [Chloroflexota bacterium]
MSDIQSILDATYEKYKDVTDGTVASYIPELAKADPNWFGIVVVTTDGDVYGVGDVSQGFTIQSTSKPFTYGLALEDNGRQRVIEKVAVEPVGKQFNAIVLDEKTGRPPNPMMNAGALVIASMIEGATLTEKLNRILAMFQRYSGRKMYFDGIVFTSERQTSFRNRAMGNLLRSTGAIELNVEEVLDLYIQQCAVVATTTDLAMMAATFANGGVHPLTGERALQTKYVRDVLSVMHSCGMYDSSGEWAYRVGIPAKSGVSGAIFGVLPNNMGIAVFSPPLDERGHSVRGVKVFEELSERLCLHIFQQC